MLAFGFEGKPVNVQTKAKDEKKNKQIDVKKEEKENLW